MNTIKEYIAEQPSTWRAMLAAPPQAMITAAVNRCERILLIGTGSSYNAAVAAAPLFEKLLKAETTAVMPTRIPKCLPDGAHTLVMVISQSGCSTSTMKSALAFHQAGYQVVAVTADEHSPIASCCKLHWLVGCGEETIGPKTKGVTGTILALYLFAISLAQSWQSATHEQITAVMSALALSFDNAQENLRRSEAFVHRHLDALIARPHFTFISEDVGYPTAMESALKVLETLYVPAYAYEFEEYLHGVQNTIAKTQCNILLAATEQNAERMVRLDAFAMDKGCMQMVVTTLAAIPPAPHVLHLLGSGDPLTLPFELMFFGQLLSAHGSAAKGINCNKPQFPEYIRLMETKE
ncbi:MAG: SIS domain-containing protein [Clostridiales bacterium]|nr:SIS domain-containing protein [Clostridiales bacterium]